MDKGRRKHDLVGSTLDHLVREQQPVPKKQRSLSLRRPRLSSSSHPSHLDPLTPFTSTSSATPPSEPATANGESHHDILNPQCESTTLVSPLDTSAFSQENLQETSHQDLQQDFGQDSRQDIQWTRHTQRPGTNGIPAKDSQTTVFAPDTEDSKEFHLQEADSFEIKVSIVSSVTETTCRDFTPTPVEQHAEEGMQETTKGHDHIDEIHSSPAALEPTHSVNDLDCGKGLNKDGKDDHFVDDEIEDWDLDDFDQDSENAMPKNAMPKNAMPENACPICGIDLSSLDTMASAACIVSSHQWSKRCHGLTCLLLTLPL